MHESVDGQPVENELATRSKLYKRVVVLDSVIFYPEHRARLAEIAESVEEYPTCTTKEEVLSRSQGADCIISCWVDIPREVIDENPQLKTIAFWTHAYEHRIDIEYATERGIYVPSIPDYGTDSVAELVFIALLQVFKDTVKAPDAECFGEEVVAQVSDEVRFFTANVRDTLNGRWIHEYVKSGRLRLTSSDEIPEDTLKGLTVGVLGPDLLRPDLVQIMARGFRINVIYSLGDSPHHLDAAYRPVDRLLDESNVLVYDSRALPEDLEALLRHRRYLATVDVGQLVPKRTSLVGKSLGIVGLGRIGARVAQIAVDGFGQSVRYYSRTRRLDLENTLRLEYMNLSDILQQSDILSFHLPHHGAEDLLSDSLIQRIPAGAVVVNVGVGNVISDERAFLSRFERGELKGYIDVYRRLPPRHELRRLSPNLIATYRLGWRTKATVGLKTHKLITKISRRRPMEGGTP